MNHIYQERERHTIFGRTIALPHEYESKYTMNKGIDYLHVSALELRTSTATARQGLVLWLWPTGTDAGISFLVEIGDLLFLSLNWHVLTEYIVPVLRTSFLLIESLRIQCKQGLMLSSTGENHSRQEICTFYSANMFSQIKKRRNNRSGLVELISWTNCFDWCTLVSLNKKCHRL